MRWLKALLNQPTEPYCPVCGYYCLGKGGMECIDRPMAIAKERLRDERTKQEGSEGD